MSDLRVRPDLARVERATGTPRSDVPTVLVPPAQRHSTWVVARWDRIHALTLAVAGVLLVHAGRNAWFFADDWEFLANRGILGSRVGIWAPHVDHWSTGPILVWRAMEWTFGLASYRPFLVLNVAVHLAVGHLLWRVAGRAGASDPARTWATALFLVANTIWIEPVWAFQISFHGALALGLGAILLVERSHASRRRLSGAAVAALAMVTFCSIAVPLLGAIGAVGVVRQGWRRTAGVVAPATGAFVAWYSLVERRDSSIDPGNLAQAARFAGRGTRDAIAGPLHLDGRIGWLVLAVVAGLLIRRRHAWGRELLAPVALIGAAVAFYLLVGLARVGENADAAQPRYLYVCLALWLPALAVVASAVRERLRGVADGWARSIAAGGAVLLVALSWVQLDEAIRPALAEQEGVRSLLLAEAQVIRSGEFVLDHAVPEPGYTFDLTVSDLRELMRRGGLDASSPSVPPQVARARLRLQIATASSPSFDPPAVIGDATGRSSRDCVAYDATIPWTVTLAAPASVGIDGGVTVTDDETGASATYAWQAGQAWLDVAVVGRPLTVTPSTGGVLTICPASG